MIASLRSLAYCDDNVRLRARAAISWRNAPERSRAAFDFFLTRTATGPWDFEDFEPVIPSAILAAMTASDQAVARLGVATKWVLEHQFEENEPGPLLPFGLELAAAPYHRGFEPWRGRRNKVSDCRISPRDHVERRFVDLVAK